MAIIVFTRKQCCSTHELLVLNVMFAGYVQVEGTVVNVLRIHGSGT